MLHWVLAFLLHLGRMGATRAAAAVRSEPRHRARIGRFLGRQGLRPLAPATVWRAQVLGQERQAGTFFFRIDPTRWGQQGQRTANPFHTGNRPRRPGQGRRYNQYQYTRPSGPCFVPGLLWTPSGLRVPLHRSSYSRV